MARKKKTDRRDVIAALQSRGPLSDEERPFVIVSPPERLTAQEAARYRAIPRIPQSPEELCSAALDTFHRALGDATPPTVASFLGELKHKLQAGEYHLRRVANQTQEDWFEAEAFLNQARSALEILARILHAFVPEVRDDFSEDGIPIANALRNQRQSSPQYASSLRLAEFIEQEKLIRTVSAVRSQVFHRNSLPTLARAKTGSVHLGGLTLQEFCIGIWLSSMKFSRHFLEWTITIAYEKRRRSGG